MHGYNKEALIGLGTERLKDHEGHERNMSGSTKKRELGMLVSHKY